MKANAKAVTDVVASQTALATGEADILIGGGEWVTAGIAKENPDLDYSVQRKALCCGRSRHVQGFQDKDMALKFIQYIMSPRPGPPCHLLLLLGHVPPARWRR